DWLERNLLRRVETCFPVLEPELAERVFIEELQYCLKDNVQSWQLAADGKYTKNAPQEGQAPFSAQAYLMSTLCRKR
nr:RNA degradosome polyphosphate kinase [Arenimonas sp.]